MHHHHPHRLPGFPYTGFCRYSLRFCTDGRTRVFVASSPVAVVFEQFLRAAIETGFAIIACCFMPDHVHLLVEGQAEDADGKRFICRAKQYSGFYYKRQFGTTLWQRYTYERVLREEEATRTVVRYLLANPIRDGLVQRVEDYPYVASSLYTREELLRYVETAESG